MRRRTAMAVAALCTVFALGGCGTLPPGVDGDLTNGWPAMPQAKLVMPVVGACYAMLSSGVSTGDDTTTPCVTTHDLETVYVGTFTGADAERSTAPRNGPGMVTAFADCRKNATAYLGDDYELGLLGLAVVVPTVQAWNGGARWYRCDVVRYEDMNYKTVGGDGSVKDGLRGDRPLAVTCAIITDDGKNALTSEQAVACSTPHNAEVAGLFTAPDVPGPPTRRPATTWRRRVARAWGRGTSASPAGRSATPCSAGAGTGSPRTVGSWATGRSAASCWASRTDR